MDFGTLIENDFDLIMDNVEPITLNMVDREFPKSISIANANRSQMTRELARFWNVQIATDLVQFSFSVVGFVPVLNTNNVRDKDTIVDADGRIYIVQRALLSTLQTRWDVLTKLKT